MASDAGLDTPAASLARAKAYYGEKQYPKAAAIFKQVRTYPNLVNFTRLTNLNHLTTSLLTPTPQPDCLVIPLTREMIINGLLIVDSRSRMLASAGCRSERYHVAANP